MASFTQFLKLLKKSPITDGDDTFNVDTMLNDNWDKIEAALKDTTTPATNLGLTGDKSVGAFLAAMAKVGDLNVWRRKTTISSSIPAGYNLGQEQSNIVLCLGSDSGRTGIRLSYSNSISVDNYGIITMNSPTILDVYHAQTSAIPSVSQKYVRIDKFLYGQESSNYSIGTVFYVPSGGSISRSTLTRITLSKSQVVTPYPATPAGLKIDYPVSVNQNAFTPSSTIESLGKLGDKARIEVGSYVGTGTYGASNPNSITFSFLPKLVIIVISSESGVTDGVTYSGAYWKWAIWANPSKTLLNSFQESTSTLMRTLNTASISGNTLSWYLRSTNSSAGNSGYPQMNRLNAIYTWIAFS